MPYEIEVPECAVKDADLIFAGEYDIPLNPPPDTVLDFGGNVGLFSSWAAQRWPNARITAFEPWEENIKDFKTNTRHFPNVTLEQVAVGNSSGIREMRADVNAMCHSFFSNQGETRNVQCIDAATIPSAEFVKLDCEGSEIEILERLNLSNTRAVALEAHSWTKAEQATQILDRAGFARLDRRNDANGCVLLKFARRNELPKGQKVMIGIPTYGSSPPQFWESLISLIAKPPAKIAIKTNNGDSLVSRARNSITTDFLRSDCTDLLFIDSDLIFSRDHIARILSHDVDLVGGFYPKKQEGKLNWVCNINRGETEPDERGLIRVKYIGTGFMRVRRLVFERMIELYGHRIAYSPDHAPEQTEYDFWSVGPFQYPDGRIRYLSEDWYFCQRWLDIGGKVFGDARIILKHVGQAVYPLQSQVPQIGDPDSVPRA